MLKSIVQFDPVATMTPEAAERHYVVVHTAMARRLMRHHVPGAMRYAPQHVRRTYDVAGNFEREPDAWRFIVNYHEDDHYLPRAWRDVVSADHQLCLENIRSYVVDEERVLVDLRAGQLSSAKFLFKFSATEDPAQLDDALTRLAEGFREAFGARLLIANQISSQRKTVPLARPGQMTLPEVEPSDTDLILECYFDYETWGFEFFAAEPIRTLLLKDSTARVQGYLVEEWLCIDRDAQSPDRTSGPR